MSQSTSAPPAGPSEQPKPASRWYGRLVAVFLAGLIACANVALWRGAHPPLTAPDYDGPIAGLAYNAFQRWDSPLEKRYPTTANIDADLSLLSKLTRRLRTYSSAEFPDLPVLAEYYGLKITAGVWLDTNEENSRREIEAVRAATRETGSIERIVAGNETILNGLLTPQALMKYLDELRAKVKVPVSTAEPWHIWLKYPDLAKHVDYVTVHLLPYWEGVPSEVALDYALDRFDEVKKAFPHKHVVIGEIGWPSQGDRYDGAWTSPDFQARFIREFLARTKGKHVDYFLMEAIDQPWKTANEGRVGAYWGIFNADRTAKFDFEGPVEPDDHWMLKAVLASLAAFVPIMWFLGRFRAMRLPSRLAFAGMMQASASLMVWLVALPFEYYLRPIDWAALAVLVPTLLAMIAILLANGFEFSEMFWPGNLKRHFGLRPLPAGARQPFVSVHLACCNEPPEMVIATLESLRNLDYREYEVLVLDNNTKDEALWKPVEAWCADAGPRFRFFHLENWPGFKAGALNYGLKQTDPRAEVVGVVDADYVVDRSWLRSLVSYFDDPKVAVVQSPQAHRAWSRQIFRRFMNWEYDGFFRIGMHHRNERDAIVQHGTMTLIRAPQLQDGGWAEWCICEDTELGLRLMKRGLSTVYVGRTMGEGLTPDDFAQFKKQRRRWAQGAMQIMKGHWKSLFRKGELTASQRYHFVSGWLPWFGDALHLVFAFAAMFWTIAIVAAPQYFSLPILLFMIPLFGFFAVKALFGPMLYLRRVPCTKGEVLGAALAGMALSHAIALGVFAGLTKKTAVFQITAKGKAAPTAKSSQGRFGRAIAPVREELAMLIGLAACCAAMAIWRKGNHVESAMWMAILAMQAVPYLAALVCQWLSHLPEQSASAAERTPQPAEADVIALDAVRSIGAMPGREPQTMVARASYEPSPVERRLGR